jgi:hypothetical protein
VRRTAVAANDELPARPPEPLGHRVAVDVDDAGAARAVLAVWRDVELALRPVVGPRGVVALFNRSAHLAAAAHPWLAQAGQDPASPLDLGALQALLLAHGAHQALVAGNRLLDELRGLLEHLIGHALTDRLLRTAWGPPGSSPTQGAAS